MIEAARRILRRKSASAVHVPAGAPPSLMVARDGEVWFVAMLHGGKELCRMTPKEARRQANRLIDMAWLASNPGSCPQGACE